MHLFSIRSFLNPSDLSKILSCLLLSLSSLGICDEPEIPIAKNEVKHSYNYIAAGPVSRTLRETIELNDISGIILVVGERENEGVLRTDRNIALILKENTREIKATASLLHYSTFFKNNFYTGLGATIGLKHYSNRTTDTDVWSNYCLKISVPLTLGYSFLPIEGKEQFIQMQLLMDRGWVFSYGRAF